MRRTRILWVVGAALMLSACVSNQRLYAWGKYDSTLYKHAKKPAERTEFVAGLKTVIDEAQQTGGKVPPGVYAEYGFALYEEGQRDAAIEYFEKEKALWPESTGFMEKMIQNAKRAPAVVPASATGEAAAAEGGAK